MPALLFVLKNWRAFAIGLAVIAVLSLGWYVRSVFADRAALQVEKTQLQQQVQAAVAGQKLMMTIADNVAQVHARSMRNVQHIETAPKPVFVDSNPLLLIPAGLLQAVYSSAAGSAPTGAAPVHAAGIDVPATGQPGGILPQ